MKARLIWKHCILVFVASCAAAASFAQPQPVPPKAARELDQASYVELFKQWRQYMETHGETAVGLVNLGMAYEYSGERDAALEAAATPAGRTTSLPRERIPVGSAGARADG